MARIVGQWINTDELVTHKFDLPFVHPFVILYVLSAIVGIVGGVLKWRVNR